MSARCLREQSRERRHNRRTRQAGGGEVHRGEARGAEDAKDAWLKSRSLRHSLQRQPELCCFAEWLSRKAELASQSSHAPDHQDRPRRRRHVRRRCPRPRLCRPATLRHLRPACARGTGQLEPRLRAHPVLTGRRRHALGGVREEGCGEFQGTHRPRAARLSWR